MGADKAASNLQNALRGAHQGAQPQLTRSRACSTVTSAVQSVCVFLQEHTGTSRCAPATTTGRPREEAPSALRFGYSSHFCIVLDYYLRLILSICLFRTDQLSNPDWKLIAL